MTFLGNPLTVARSMVADWPGPVEISSGCRTDGTAFSFQRFTAPRPAVPETEDGARDLARAYAGAVARVTGGLVTMRREEDATWTIALTGGPVLVRFDPERIHVEPGRVSIELPVAGGRLARQAGGALTFRQTREEHGYALTNDLEDFRPSLATNRDGLPLKERALRAVLYSGGEQRLHRLVGRCYFSRLVELAVPPSPASGATHPEAAGELGPGSSPDVASTNGFHAPLTVAVLGAGGVVGAALVPALVAGGHRVRAVSRSGGGPELEGVERVAADLAVPADAARALEGADVAVYLVHSLGRPDFAAHDRLVAATVADAAAAAGVRQLVYLGGLGDESEELSEHLRSRIETGVVLASGPVPATTLRAAVVVGADSAAFVTIVALVDRLPGMICPRWVSTPTQPIALADVVRYLVACVGAPWALGETFDVGGPEVMTYREMMDRIAALRGKSPLVVEVPVLTPRLSSLWIGLVTPATYSVARPLVDGLRNPTVCHEDRIRELVPFELTPFDDAARAAFVDEDVEAAA